MLCCAVLCYVVVWRCVERCGVAWRGGVVWRGVAWCGVAWRGVEWNGTVWCGVVCKAAGSGGMPREIDGWSTYLRMG